MIVNVNARLQIQLTAFALRSSLAKWQRQGSNQLWPSHNSIYGIFEITIAMQLFNLG